MQRFPPLACLLSFVCALSAWQSNAFGQSDSAQDEPDPFVGRPLRAEAVGGVGFGRATMVTGESLNTYGPAAGLRGGYVFSFPIYLGLRYEHFFGASEEYPVPLVSLTEYRTRAGFAGVAVGAELRLGPAYLRPELAFGALVLRTSASCTTVDGTFADLGSQVCSAQEESTTSWAPAVVPGLAMGLTLGRLYGYVEPAYYARKSADAYALVGGFGLAL